MTTKKIIEQILATHPEISREEILERLDNEKTKTGSFISDDVLLRMIAAEFGVEVSKEARTPTLSIRDLVPGLNDVTVVGRVVAVFPSKTFKANKSGKVASLLIADENSILRIVLWNDKTKVIDSGKVKVGQMTRFSHGYTKEGYSGRVELHLGDRSEIEINPKDVEAKDYPSISKFTTKIGEVSRTLKNRKVNVRGTVKKLFPVSTFERRDSSSGKVMRFIFADETGEIPVVVWNEKVDELEETLRKGVKLQLVNARAKKTINKGLEIHVNSQTYVEAITPTEEFLKIADLREGLKHVNVKGAIVSKPMLRNVKTLKGELAKLAVFEMRDEIGKIWVSAWRKHADTVSNLKVGDKVIIKNAYVKKGFGEQLEISTRSKTIITVLPQQ
ncbi:MAG: OB-fold nucleic acid binding domain-containing protein [Candidatus Bathyarchaeota archaeon]|nr:OB-fold nucleic acid binding domain-containing protein [Candidatus Bathyarchaeota archaeon]